MKNKALVLLAAIYLFSTLGVSAQSMYCMGVLRATTISYGNPSPKKADCRMAARMKKCCHTKKQLLKVNDEHFYSGTLDMLAKLFPILFNITNTDAPTCALIALTQQQTYYSHAPPNAPKTPAYVFNCSFRI